MKRNKCFKLILCLMLVFCSLPQLVGAAGAEAYIELDKAEVKVGDSITATVNLREVTQVSGAEVNLKFDPEYFRLSGAGGSSVAVVGPLASSFQIKDIRGTDGVVMVAGANTPAANGDFAFATLSFVAIKQGATRIEFSSNAEVVSNKESIFIPSTPLTVSIASGTPVVTPPEVDDGRYTGGDNQQQPLPSNPPATNPGGATPGGGGGGAGAPAPVNTLPVPKADGLNKIGETVKKELGNEGGVMSADKVQLTLPNGALLSAIEITADKITPIGSTLIQPTNKNLSFAGPVYQFGPEGTKFEQPITLTFTIDSNLTGDELEKAAIYYFNPDKKVWERIGGKVDKANGNISVQINHFSIYAVMVQNKTFEDINTHWAKKEIEVLAAHDIVNGYSGKAFLPEGQVTRAEFITMLVKMLNLPLSSDEKAIFSDVNKTDWFRTYVNTAHESGLIKGADGKFNPNRKITREEITTILINALKKDKELAELTDEEMKKLLPFQDETEIAGWAKKHASLAVKAGLIMGISKDQFAPKMNATRAQAAAMIYRTRNYSTQDSANE
ncbi:S-layer homology domain-containing protein [Ammoniphilus sp. 3BR4]|uniref:S-layer homology domain-containing protein n=1 Tax=Ammoniphilus sp. 3BR4 TaxID=3158265 RepID=UPI0034669929